MRLFSLEGKLAGVLVAVLLIGCTTTALLARWLPPWFAASATFAALALPALMLAHLEERPARPTWTAPFRIASFPIPFERPETRARTSAAPGGSPATTGCRREKRSEGVIDLDDSA